MGLITLVLALVVIGVLLEVLKTYLTIEPLILIVIRLVILIAVVYYLAVLLGVPNIPVPRVR